MNFKGIFTALVLFFLGFLCSLARPMEAHKHMDAKLKENATDSIRILWIGNSFTFYNDLPQMVEDTGKLNGIPVSTSRILKGGESLAGHLTNPELHKEIQKGGWDYVVLQEFSSTPAYSTKFVAENILPYAAEIDSLVKSYSPEAETIYYMTWGHKNGNTRQTDYPLDDTYESMQERIFTTYFDMAYENHGMLAPVGVAWKNIRNKYPQIELYIEDDFHPSLAGSVLAADTIFATMSGAEFIPLEIEGLDPGIRSILYQEAVGAVKVP